MKFEELYKKARLQKQLSLDEDLMWSNIEEELDKSNRKRVIFWIWGILFFIFSVTIAYKFVCLPDDYEKEGSISKEVNWGKENSSEQKMNDFSESISNSNKYNQPEEKFNATEQILHDTIQSKIDISNKINIPNKITENNSFKIKDLEVHPAPIAEYIDSTKVHLTTSKTQINFDLSPKEKEYLSNVTALKLPFKSLLIPPRKIPNTRKVQINKTEDQRKLQLAFSLGYLKHTGQSSPIKGIINSWDKLHESSKTSNLGLEFDILFRKKYFSGLSLAVGPRIRLLSEWYDAQVTSESVINTPSDSASFYVINGISEFNPGVLTSRIINRTNYHTPVRRLFIDIPIELGFMKRFDKITLESSLSYNINISHSYFGRSYTKDLELLPTNELKANNVFKSHAVNSFNYKIGVSYKLSKNNLIGFDINYWKQISSSINTNQMIIEKNSALGLGLKYSFIL